jgi:hypothetical protein
MSYNGTGTFNINTAGQPVVTGTTITSTAFNLLTADLASGLTNAVTKDGQTTPTANIPMGTYKITGLGAGTSATDAAQYGQLQAGATTIATVTGTDTLAGTLTPAPTAYATGNLFSFVAANTNTGASTININSLGAKSITKSGTSALVAGDMVSGRVYLIEYDGTRFQLINPSSAGVSTISFGSTGLTPSTATSGAVTVAGTLAIANGGTNSTATATSGGVGYGTGTAHAYSAAGTSGQFLQSNGASAPTWTTVGSSAMVLISTLTASSSTSLAWTGLTTYNNYFLILDGLVPSAADDLLLQVGYGATPTYSGSSFVRSSLVTSGTASVAYSKATSSVIRFSGFVNNQGTDSLTGLKGTVYLFNTLVSSKDFAYSLNSSFSIDGGATTPENLIGNGWWPSTPGAITAVRLIYNGGSNIASGKASLYGIAS